MYEKPWDQLVQLMSSRTRVRFLATRTCGLAMLLCAYSALAADNESLYFSDEISPPAGVSGCVEAQAKVKPWRGDLEPAHTSSEKAARDRSAEILRKLPPAQTAAARIAVALQQRMRIPLSNLAAGGRKSGPDCLGTINLREQTLIVITISISERYQCNDSNVCSLPTTVTYAVCYNFHCRAEQLGYIGIEITADTFNDQTTILQSTVERTLQNAFSRLK